MNAIGKLTFLILLFPTIISISFGQTNEELDRRLYEVEKSLEQKNPILPMDADQFRFGGFLTSTWSHIDNDKTSESSFNSNRFELLLDIDVSDNIEFFTAFGVISSAQLRDSDGSPAPIVSSDPDRTYDSGNRQQSTPLIISHGTYKLNRYANFKIGRFIAPVGIINVEHFPPGLFLETVPQFLRPAPGGKFWGNFLDGVDFYGIIPFENSSLKYHLNYSNFAFSNANANVEGDPTRAVKGARLAYSFWRDRITLGGSWQKGGRAFNSTPTISYNNVGGDILLRFGNFNMKNEFVYAAQDNAADQMGYIIQPSYGITDTVRLVYRYDFLDQDKANDNNDPKEVTEHIFGVNWKADKLLRLRAEYKLVKFDADTVEKGDPDYNELLLSAIVSF